ncbi:hypothetical protein [Clostridium sp. Marseille-Q7071]
MRLSQLFINNRGLYLGDNGFKIQPNNVEFNKNCITFYHYTYVEYLDKIFSSGNGLFAHRRVSCPNIPQEFNDCYLIEGFLEPLSKWLTDDYYFSDLSFEMTKKHVGNILLKVELPRDFNGLYIADYAYVLEEKHKNLRGISPLGLEYDCSNGYEITQAYVNSYVPANEYNGKHIAPVMQVLRK